MWKGEEDSEMGLSLSESDSELSPDNTRRSLLRGNWNKHIDPQISSKILAATIGLMAFVTLVILALIYWGSQRPDIDFPLLPVVPFIILSIDGFRYEYLSTYQDSSPHLNNLIKTGVLSPLRSVFPSKTFPNHFSIVTGLYPETHGIVSNYMYDPQMNATFSIRDPKAQVDPRWWKGGEPIWITAVKNSLNSAVCFWPGSESTYAGLSPTYNRPFDQSVPSAERAKQILNWLDKSQATRPTFSAWYIDVVDTAGHLYGPFNQSAISKAIKEADDAIGVLLDGLKGLGLDGKVNLMVVSDHGMTTISTDRVEYLEDYMNVKDVQFVDWSPIATMVPNDPKKMDEIVNGINSKAKHIKAYRKENLPLRFHYVNNDRIPPLVVVAEDGWSIAQSRPTDGKPLFTNKGNHGYDPELDSMTSIMVANGPQFKRAMKGNLIENVQIYNLMCSLLRINCAVNNGTLPAIIQVLNPDPDLTP